MKVWTEIAAERLAGNFRALSSLLNDGASNKPVIEATALLAVVKANAYGHGIDPCAAVLVAAGAEWLGVTDAHEGARVRAVLAASGLPEADQPEILVMSGTVGLKGEAECIVRNRLTAVVLEPSHVTRLGDAARAAEATRPVRVHLEVDSGMSRQGLVPGKALDAMLRAIVAEPLVVLDGLFTHFSSTEVAASEQTAAQQRNFESAIAQVGHSGLSPQWMHVGNSSYIDNSSDGTDSLKWLELVAGRLVGRPMVRSGLALYGYLLPIEGQGSSLAGPKVLPVMTWKTRVIGVRDVPAGSLVGYSGAFAAERPMRLALLPIGYADGLRRELSSTNLKGKSQPGGWVMLRGERAPIVGRVSMNLTTVDVTGISGAAEGDEVVILGDGVTADDHARLAGTIAYEILCGVKTAE